MSVTVTVAILSHNHKGIISKAIESVLFQQINYTYELLLFDDGSTDGTKEILKSYYNKEPEKIKLFLFEKSEGPVIRAKQIYENAKGKYLAWMDGDDYWTYNLKLQKQIDFLESHPEYIGCFHDAEIISSIQIEKEVNQIAKKQTRQKYKYYSQFNHYEPDFYPFDLLQRNVIPTASLVFRLSNLNYFFENYHFPMYSFSWAFQLFLIKNTKFRYFNECWSVYYDHNEGITKKISSEKFTLNNINILKWYKHDSFYKKYKNKIFLSIAKEYEILTYKNGRMLLKYAFWLQFYYFKTWWWTLCYFIQSAFKSLIMKY